MKQHRNLKDATKKLLISLIIIVLLIVVGIFGTIIKGLEILAYIAIIGLLIMIIYIPFLFRRVQLMLNCR